MKKGIIRILLYCELAVPSLVCTMLWAGQRRELMGKIIQIKKINQKSHLTLQPLCRGSSADHSTQNELKDDF